MEKITSILILSLMFYGLIQQVKEFYRIAKKEIEDEKKED